MTARSLKGRMDRIDAPLDWYAWITFGILGTGILLVAPDWALQTVESVVDLIPGVHLGIASQSNEETQALSLQDEKARFNQAYLQTMKWEGSQCSNVVGDAGGLTCKGITDSTYQSWLRSKGSPARSVTSISDDEAKQIYWERYWVASGAGKLPAKLGVIAFDVAVNSGVGEVSEIVGQPESNVSAWANHALARREDFYKRIAVGKKARFLAGWLNRNNDLKRFVVSVQDAPTQGHVPGHESSPVSVVSVYSGLELGAGVYVAPDQVLTALHVVRSGSAHIGLPSSNGTKSVSATVIRTDAANDLALLQVDEPGVPVELGDTPKPGDAAQVSGNSGNHLHTFPGKILSVSPGTVTYSPQAVKGDSGGPVLVDGKLIGINSRAENGSTTAIGTNVIRRFIQ